MENKYLCHIITFPFFCSMRSYMNLALLTEYRNYRCKRITLFLIEWAMGDFHRKVWETVAPLTPVWLAQSTEIRLYCPQRGNWEIHSRNIRVHAIVTYPVPMLRNAAPKNWATMSLLNQLKWFNIRAFVVMTWKSYWFRHADFWVLPVPFSLLIHEVGGVWIY